jgi:nucleoside 2-deoxyribosyltransferase
MELKTTSTAKDKLTIYLGGPIFGRSDDDCKAWREKIRDTVTEVHCLDPMSRDYRERLDEPGIDREIVENDKRDIDEAEILVVYFDKPSVGTAMEILYAFERGKYILVINVSKGQSSPWLTYHASNTVKSLDEAIVVVKEAAKQYNVYEVGVWGEEGM